MKLIAYVLIPALAVLAACGGSSSDETSSPTARDASPVWSPDGTRIAFVSNVDGSPDIFVMNRDGSAETNLTRDASSNRDPAWAPDGSRIAFVSNRGGNDDIFVMNADGGGQTNLTRSPGTDSDYSWSPDGTKIAFESTRDDRSTTLPPSSAFGGSGQALDFANAEIYVMDSDGSNQVRLTDNEATDANPKWSPDGTLIMFHSNRDVDADVYTMRPDGSAQTVIASSPATDANAIWSPDGRAIAFTSTLNPQGFAITGNQTGDITLEDLTENFEVYVAATDGGGWLNISENPENNDTDPRWSPDGSRITFVGRLTARGSGLQGGGAIYLATVALQTNRSQLTVNPSAFGNDRDTQSEWSPDGSSIVFVSQRRGPAEIWVMDANGGNQRPLTNRAQTR